jgi:hypothetical protein
MERAMTTNAHATQSNTAIPLSEQHAVRRAMAVVGLASIALIHVLDLQGKLKELPYVGVMFIGLIVSCLVVAEALIRIDDRRAWFAAGALSAATMLGYAVSRTVGLPGDHDDDVGNWLADKR